MGVGLDGSGLRCVWTGVKCALGWTNTSGRPPSLFSCVCWAMADQDKATVFRELYCCSSCAAPGEIDHQSVGRDKRSTLYIIYTHTHTLRLYSNSKWGIEEDGLQKKKKTKSKNLCSKKEYCYKRMIFQTFRKVSIHYVAENNKTDERKSSFSNLCELLRWHWLDVCFRTKLHCWLKENAFLNVPCQTNIHLSIHFWYTLSYVYPAYI